MESVSAAKPPPSIPRQQAQPTVRNIALRCAAPHAYETERTFGPRIVCTREPQNEPRAPGRENRASGPTHAKLRLREPNLRLRGRARPGTSWRPRRAGANRVCRRARVLRPEPAAMRLDASRDSFIGPAHCAAAQARHDHANHQAAVHGSPLHGRPSRHCDGPPGRRPAPSRAARQDPMAHENVRKVTDNGLTRRTAALMSPSEIARGSGAISSGATWLARVNWCFWPIAGSRRRQYGAGVRRQPWTTPAPSTDEAS